MASPRFRAAVILEARQRANLTQLELATLADEATNPGRRAASKSKQAVERTLRIGAWESRIGAWERGVDAPSAPYVPTLARVLGVKPLELFEVDPVRPPFTALRLASGFTLQALSEATGISYTSLHRMTRGVSKMPDDAAKRLAKTLAISVAELHASIARDR